MLAKITAHNQLTLPRSITGLLGPVEYVDVEARNDQIVLTPVSLLRGDTVLARLAELDLSAAAINDAVAWARAATPSKPAPVTAGHS